MSIITNNNQTSSLQKVVIKAGECAYLPSDAVIASVDNTSSLSIDSECIDFTVVPDKSCYIFTWDVLGVNGGFLTYVIDKIIVGNGSELTIIDPPGFPSNQFEDGGLEAEKLAQAINLSSIPAKAIAFDQGVSGLRQIKISLPTFSKLPYLKISRFSSGAAQFIYLEGVLSPDCATPPGWGTTTV